MDIAATTAPTEMRVGDRFNPHSLFHGCFVPEALCRCVKISPGAKLCYARLTRYGGKDGKCHPSVPMLAAELGISTRQCRNYLRQLEQQGFIRRVSRGKGHSNSYEFLWHAIFQGQPRKDTSARRESRRKEHCRLGSRRCVRSRSEEFPIERKN